MTKQRDTDEEQIKKLVDEVVNGGSPFTRAINQAAVSGTLVAQRALKARGLPRHGLIAIDEGPPHHTRRYELVTVDDDESN